MGTGVCVCARACEYTRVRAHTSATSGLSPLPNNEEPGIIPIELLMEKYPPGWTAQATLLLPCWETALSDHSLTVPRLRQKPWVKGSAVVQHSHRPTPVMIPKHKTSAAYVGLFQ